MSLCLSLLLCRVSQPSSTRSFSILHSLVAPDMILSASIWIASSFFFESEEALSHTESQYSKSGRINEVYILSSAFRLTLNLRDLRRLSRDHPFLAHLSRRLTGELMDTHGSGVRPSASVVHIFKHLLL